MPKVTINVDTEAKKLDFILNGSAVENVESVSIFKNYEGDEYYIRLSTVLEQDGVRTYTEHMLECECEEEAMSTAKASFLEGFVEKGSENEIHKQIQKWLKNG